MSLSPTSVEVERAKSQLKASLLLGLDGTTAVAEDVSRRLRLPNLVCILFADREVFGRLASASVSVLQIGRQMVTTGKRFTPQEIARSIDAITVEDIQRCAKTYLWDKDIAIAAIGQTEGLLDYNRIRADMSSMIY